MTKTKIFAAAILISVLTWPAVAKPNKSAALGTLVSNSGDAKVQPAPQTSAAPAEHKGTVESDEDSNTADDLNCVDNLDRSGFPSGGLHIPKRSLDKLWNVVLDVMEQGLGQKNGISLMESRCEDKGFFCHKIGHSLELHDVGDLTESAREFTLERTEKDWNYDFHVSPESGWLESWGGGGRKAGNDCLALNKELAFWTSLSKEDVIKIAKKQKSR